MSTQTKVILITGFLGSGKTTFLNKIIETVPDTLKLTILMNEFGEIGIDGALIEGDDIDMLEISRGSIFCVCVKTDFIKGLYELSSTLKPDILVIESTGVANPTDLKRDLRLPIFENRFDFTEQFCVIDAPHFLEAFEVFASVEKQLETSSIFIINKVDMVDGQMVTKIQDLVRDHHPDPIFFETSYCSIPLDAFPYLMVEGNRDNSDAHQPAFRPLSAAELDEFVTKAVEDPELETSPPDQLASITYEWHGSNVDDITEKAKILPEEIVRAKGFITQDNVIYLFSYVMGDWTVEEVSPRIADEIEHMNYIVFIGSFPALESIRKILEKPDWSAQEILQPFVQIMQM